MNIRDEIDHWAKIWDKAQDKWAADPQTAPAPQQPPQKSDSFFGLQSNPVPEAPVSQDQGKAWWDIYTRSSEIRGENPQPEPNESQVFQEQANSWKRLLGQSEKIQPRPQAQAPADPNRPMTFREQAEGWKKLLSAPGKGVTFQQHPQHHMSIGMDQGKSPYEPTRVAPNFTDGPQLSELSELKVKLEKLESTLLSQEIKAGKANVPPSEYKNELDKLRQRIDSLSDKLTPEPGTDVY